MSKALVVFDFDYSLINDNSDTYVIEKLAPHLMEVMKELRRTTFKDNWTQLMHHMVTTMIIEEGITLQAMNECLTQIPIFSENIEAIRLAAERGAELAVLSDANTHYIDIILGYHNLLPLFSKIVTNYAGVDKTSGALWVKPHQDINRPHGCVNCPPNLCKGAVLAQWRTELPADCKVIYIGDGGGDYCPCLSLRDGDVILCRKQWALHKKLKAKSLIAPAPDDSAPVLLAEVVPWDTGADILRTFERVL